MSGPTLRSLLALPTQPQPLSKSALIIIDAQNTYREGVMQLENVEPALAECAVMLERARKANAPVFHIQHDEGAGTPYDVNARIGQIAEPVAPRPGELIITKNYPSSFEKTALDAHLKAAGVTDLVIVGFMTHVCVNSTARVAFNLGYRPTVVANATATRSLPAVNGRSIPAAEVHDASLAALGDIFAIVVPDEKSIPQ
jgi:nicotinamidase-related amidase